MNIKCPPSCRGTVLILILFKCIHWIYICVYSGSGYRALSWCRLGWTRNWTRRKCWKAENPTSASPCRWPTTAPCNTAARCRETPAARPVTVTENTHTNTHRCWSSRCCGVYISLWRAHPTITEHKKQSGGKNIHYIGPKTHHAH